MIDPWTFLMFARRHRWDPATDHVFVIANDGPGDSFNTIFVNGSATPDAIELRRGVMHRLRFIAIPANGEFVALGDLVLEVDHRRPGHATKVILRVR